MSLFDIYVRLKECIPKNIRLHRSLKGSALMMGNVIYLNGNASEENQVQFILHEIVHDIPKFKDKSRNWNHNPVIEDEIEKYAQEIYHRYKIVNDYVMEQLRLAKSNDENWMG